MSQFSILRDATIKDIELLRERGIAFAKRHNISLWLDDMDRPIMVIDAIEQEIKILKGHAWGSEQRRLGARLERLWNQVATRAVGDKEISFGKVGHRVK